MNMLSFCEIAPISMLFVRCEGGISHVPEENVYSDDGDLAASVLTDALLLMRQENAV